jgi:hypothetical protein
MLDMNVFKSPIPAAKKEMNVFKYPMKKQQEIP